MLIEKRPEQFADAALDDEVVLIDADSGEFFAIKDSALAIWQRLDKESDLDRVIASLCEDFHVSAEQCRADVEVFVAQLAERGYVRCI
ncbi:MAG TPA: HPr-rel-A system PqqD family peptide chaperone [Alteraurantiacibacter sp.]